MPEGDKGKEQFRNAITELKNLHVATALAPLFDLRNELILNDEFLTRGGIDNATQKHLLDFILYADRVRRRVTYNPDNTDLGVAIEEAMKVKGNKKTDEELGSVAKPFAGDLIQNASGPLFPLPWALDGSDDDIPLNSALNLRNSQARILLGAIDRAIVQWTRGESRNRTRFITKTDSFRAYGSYLELTNFIRAFGGDANRVDLAQGVLPSEEPQGVLASPNRRGETSGGEGPSN